MLILQILAAVAILLLGFILVQLLQISSAIKALSHQLEYLGAPVDISDGELVAKRKSIDAGTF